MSHRAPRVRRETLRVLDLARMVSENPPPVPWIVDGLAVRGALTLLTGREGEGKSLLTLALATGIADGSEVAGFDCKPGTALIVDGENGEHEIWRRVHCLGLPPTGVVPVEADGFDLRRLVELEALLAVHRPALLVLDSFRSLWPGGDENDSAAVASVLDPLRALARRFDVATMLLHHLPKGGSSYRGSTAIGAAVKLGFKLTRADGDPERRERRRLECFKCRPAPEPDARWLRLHVERGQVFVDAAEPYEAGMSESSDRTPPRTELRTGHARCCS